MVELSATVIDRAAAWQLRLAPEFPAIKLGGMSDPAAPDPKRLSVIVPAGEVKVIRALAVRCTCASAATRPAAGSSSPRLSRALATAPPVHWHENEDECFIVTEGRLNFLTGGEWKEVGPGGIVFTPKKTIHTYRNDSGATATMEFISDPAGFEVFFAECAIEFAKPGGPDHARIVEISHAHGIYYV
ncbi:MAG: cupin domain-containing protein [Verrucomicrobiota bacterium]